jgi:branched-chain amino acid transport system ATP-binding protein
MSEILRTEKLTMRFGGVVAVSTVDLVVNRKEICAVIGPNGAGKSTLFNVITQYLEPTSGKVYFEGEEIVGTPPHVICRKGLARSFQLTNIYPRLTVFDSVQVSLLSIEGLGGSLFRSTKKLLREETERILGMVGLMDQRHVNGNLLSHGDKKRLELAISLGTRPKMLLMDEPTAGMAPDETWALVELVDKLRNEEDLTVLFTEHDMDVVFDIADKLVVLHQGVKIAEGAPEEVQKDARVQECYLGVQQSAAQ